MDDEAKYVSYSLSSSSHSICIRTQARNHSFRKGLLAVILPHNNINMIKELEFTRR